MEFATGVLFALAYFMLGFSLELVVAIIIFVSSCHYYGIGYCLYAHSRQSASTVRYRVVGLSNTNSANTVVG